MHKLIIESQNAELIHKVQLELVEFGRYTLGNTVDSRLAKEYTFVLIATENHCDVEYRSKRNKVVYSKSEIKVI